MIASPFALRRPRRLLVRFGVFAMTSEPTDLVADGLSTVREAAGFLRLSRSTVYTLMDRGELPFVKLGRSRRIPRRALVELAARGLRGGSRFAG